MHRNYFQISLSCFEKKKFQGKSYESLKILSKPLWFLAAGGCWQVFYKRPVLQILSGVLQKGRTAEVAKTPENSQVKSLC